MNAFKTLKVYTHASDYLIVSTYNGILLCSFFLKVIFRTTQS